LPEHLPREVHTHLAAEDACPACGGQLRTLGEDISEVLEYIPASFKPGSPRTGLRPWGGR
jgi:transposase